MDSGGPPPPAHFPWKLAQRSHKSADLGIDFRPRRLQRQSAGLPALRHPRMPPGPNYVGLPSPIWDATILLPPEPMSISEILFLCVTPSRWLRPNGTASKRRKLPDRKINDVVSGYRAAASADVTARRKFATVRGDQNSNASPALRSTGSNNFYLAPPPIYLVIIEYTNDEEELRRAVIPAPTPLRSGIPKEEKTTDGMPTSREIAEWSDS